MDNTGRVDLNDSMVVTDSGGSNENGEGIPPTGINEAVVGTQSQHSNATEPAVEGKRERMEKMRRTVRRHFKTLEAAINVELSKKDVDLDKVKTLLVKLTAIFDELVRQDTMILMDSSQIMTEEEEDEDLKDRLVYHEKIAEINHQVNRLAGPSTSAVAIQAPMQATQSQIKFAEIDIEKFAGDYKQWLPFWAQFKKIDEDKKMPDNDKMLRLVNAVKKNSLAHEVVAPYAGSDNCYGEAINALKRRFGDPNILLQVYITDLLELCIKNGSGKETLEFSSLFAKIDASYRALKTLELAKADPDIWLYPLVEAALPEETLVFWQRSPEYGGRQSNRLKVLLAFMEKEVQLKQSGGISRKLSSGLYNLGRVRAPSSGNKTSEPGTSRKRDSTHFRFHVTSGKPKGCMFCTKENHLSSECRHAAKMSSDERRNIMRKRGCCFICLGDSHMSRDCRNKEKIVCGNCGKPHLAIFCYAQKNNDGGPASKRGKKVEPPRKDTTMTNQVREGDVCLQTLLLRLSFGYKWKFVRAFMDTGSSRSYMLKNSINKLGLPCVAEETAIHALFDGVVTRPINHKIYDLNLTGVGCNLQKTIRVRDSRQLCPPMKKLDSLVEILKSEMESKDITVSDVGHDIEKVEVLLGADVYGQLLTGKCEQLSKGITAIQTVFGWTLLGEFSNNDRPQQAASVYMSMASVDISIRSLWELDSLGITDPLERLSEKETEEKAKERFFRNITRNRDGRYSIKLPWRVGHPPLPSHKEIALTRLRGTCCKLKSAGLLSHYNKLFKDWEAEGFIEETSVNSGVGNNLTYSPHRAVIKPESTTTPVRPVFDCSCKSKGSFSLNECLHKGQSYILRIPEVMLRFRERQIGFVADIRKAFQMIEVAEEDRDALRFLWWKTKEMTEIKEYRHARVPFGATCSPFILGAILEMHILKVHADKKISQRLWESIYVDNVCCSADTKQEYHEFKDIAVGILNDAQMDLRLWLSNVENVDDAETQCISVLGLKWNRKTDTLFVNIKDSGLPIKITKRTILSALAGIFDPLGFLAPALLPMKLLLQRTWNSKLKWDEELPDTEQREFKKWHDDHHELGKIHIPRALCMHPVDHSKWQLHTFADGSKSAYATVTFLRIEHEGSVHVSFLSCHSRVAPLKFMTIPRLELMGCLIGARQSAIIKESLGLINVKQYLWTDSTTALAWIVRNSLWGTFVGNRVAEIVKLTNPNDWYHVPGEFNPADLPSRGRTPSEYYHSNYWTGPSWLRKGMESWPQSKGNFNESEILKEHRKVTAEVASMSNVSFHFSRKHIPFYNIVRVHALVRRIAHNWIPGNKANKKRGPFLKQEMDRAEIDVILRIQEECFSSEKGKARLNTLETVKDEYGVIRIKTRLTNLPDDRNFRFPAVLPGNHHAVQQMIFDQHKAYCHAGVGFLMTTIRKKFWILKARKSIKYITTKCYTCRRLTAKPTITQTAPLPLDRIKNAEVFEITGVDLAGPFFTKNGKKIWLALYTCAVYRAVSIFVLTSLSTPTFLKSLDGFIDKYRRPAVIYSDNGTNFRGADNLFKELDWDRIQSDYQVKRIVWKFNPPTAAWWGGWWERLIRVMKDLIRKEIGNILLTKDELVALMRRVEEVMNGRPLTYVSEDPNDLEPLTPNHFLRPFGNAQFPENDCLDGTGLRSRYHYLTTVKETLKLRFKKEYLANLISRHPKKATRPLRLGELVIVGSDNQKRSSWPLARIVELMEGSDGVARVARLKTKDGEMVRPVQRLYALEADQKEPVVSVDELRSIYGRKLKRTQRYEG